MNLNNTQLNGYAPIEITLPDGEVITLDSYVDDHGTRRYVANRVVDAAFNENLFSLNRIAALVQQLDIPIKDRIVFWSMLGYSVSGMCDLVNVLSIDKCKVVTPEWTSDPVTDDEEDE